MSGMAHFRFLDLPRELRDQVYELLTLPSKTISPGFDDQDTKVLTTSIPFSSLLQVSEQILSEYTDLLPPSRPLHVLGGHCDYWTGYPPIPGPLARSISTCTIFIHIQDFCDNMTAAEHLERSLSPIQCDAVDFLHNYSTALQTFLSQFPHLISAHLRIGLWGSEDVEEENFESKMSERDPPCLSHSSRFPEALKMLVALPLEVQDLEVVRVYAEGEYSEYCNEEEHGLPTYFTWSRSRGWRPGSLLLGND